MRSLESWILSYLLNSLWQVPLLYAAGWIAARALRPAGPEAEHRVWVSVLFSQSFLPAVSLLPWQWLRTLFVWVGGARGSGSAHVSVVMGAGAASRAFRPSAWLLVAIAVAYGATCAYFAARFIWRCGKLHAMRKQAAEVVLTGEAALRWAQCSERFGVNGVSIAASSRIFGPVTLGLSRKLVLLPVSMVSGLPEADMHAVIAHEFAHIQRNDFLKNLIYELLALPANYHPLLRLTRERIMESREIVCDRMAAEVGGRRQYARSLLRLASLLVEGVPARTPHAIGIFDANTFERRIMNLTQNQIELRGMRRLIIVAACAAFGIATCGSALALHMQVDAAAAGSGASNTAGALSVKAGEMAGNKISGSTPKYPEEAKKARVQGTVVLNALIGNNGSIKNLEVASGPEQLQKSSLDAVRQWKYKPFLLNGEPVAVKTTINVVYTLAK